MTVYDRLWPLLKKKIDYSITIMTTPIQGMFLDDEKDVESAMKVEVRPVVLFSILDHFMRRKKDQKRVIGSFLFSS